MAKIEIKKVKLSEIKLNPDNPRTISKKNMDRLVKSLSDFPEMLEIREIVCDESMTVLGGNMRLKALKKAGAKECLAKIVSGLTDDQKREFVIKDNGSWGEWSMDDLANAWGDLPLVEWGIKLPDDWIKTDEQQQEKPVIEKINPLDADDVILKQIEQCNKIIYQFSGGRDSTLAILKTLELTKNKDRVAVHVDTGVEFPDLLYWMQKFCREHDLPFKVVHSKKNFFEIYEPKQCWPDSIFRDCITPLINDPCDNYIKETGVDCLLIRGGRKKQKTTRSKSDLYNKIGSNKHIKKLLNPLFFLSNDQYNEEIKKVPVWEGYEKGFVRTACWCCPFQQPQQWKALKEYYPMLWEQMREMAGKWIFKNHPGDGNIKRFRAYWQEFTKC